MDRTDERRSYTLLLGSVTASVVVLGIVRTGGVQLVAVNALLGVSLLLSVRIAHAAPPVAALALGIAVLGFVAGVVLAVTGSTDGAGARLMAVLLVVFGPPAVALGVVRHLRATEEVREEAVMGVLALYMLVGLLFAFVFGAIDRLGDGSFFADGVPATGSNCVYFSFTTLTTTGYGDLSARSGLGHTLSVFEALLGQIYLVTVVSLIVSNLKRRPRGAER